MQTIKLLAKSGTCKIFAGMPVSKIGKIVAGMEVGKVVIVTDATTKKALGAKFPKYPTIVISEGDWNKTLGTIEKIYRKFVQMGLERDSFVIAIGGGNVCDVAGFAAATYMRGIRFGFVPTTLTAQADAAIGGKNGVNLDGYKNLVGTFRQPEFVVCDPEALSTLSAREVRCGIAEIIKHAAIADRKLFLFLEKKMAGILELDSSKIKKILFDSIKIKAKIVTKDEFEKNERKKLNFGHTMGHAIEKCACVPHGEAVAIGMIIEAGISVRKGMLKEEEEFERLRAIILRAGLPTSTAVEENEILDAIMKDKKLSGSVVRMPLLRGIGKCELSDVKLTEIRAALHDLC